MITIIITGPSASGKSNLSIKLKNIFDNSIIIKTDSYYRDNLFIKILSHFMFDIYDRPLSIKKNEIMKIIESIYNKEKQIYINNYNFEKKKSTKSSIIINYEDKDKNQFLIIEGVFSHCLEIDYKNSINIMCKEDKEICFNRRLIRDQIYRGRSSKEVKKKFNKSWYLFFKNIKTFLKINKVITINPADKLSYETLVSNLKQIKKY